MNLIASTSTRCHLFPYSPHTRVLPYIEFKVLIGYWSLFPAIPPLVGEDGLLSTSLHRRRQRCYHSLWSSLHRWGLLMKQWLPFPGSSCIESSHLFPFSCSTFSKSSFCYEQAVGQRHQSQCQCIRVHHTVIPARVPSMENNTRFSLFIMEQYLRNRVSDHCVYV